MKLSFAISLLILAEIKPAVAHEHFLRHHRHELEGHRDLQTYIPASKIWSGPPFTFTKPDNVDGSDSQYQDCLNADVCIARGDHHPIYNGLTYDFDGGMEWAWGTTADPDLQFKYLTGLSGFPYLTIWSYFDLPGSDTVLHLIDADVYIDLHWNSWSCCGAGGFSYTRSTEVSDQPPTALCASYTLVLGADGHGSITTANVDGGSSDNEGPVNLSLSRTEFDCSDMGASPVTVALTVEDTAGQTATCPADVTIADQAAPTISCETDPPDMVVGPDCTSALVPDDYGNYVSWTDNCGAVVSTNPADTSALGADDHPITFTAMDASGNLAQTTCVVKVLHNTCGKNNDKVEICHVPAGDPEKAQTQCVSLEGALDHLADHPEDYCGPCE